MLYFYYGLALADLPVLYWDTQVGVILALALLLVGFVHMVYRSTK